MISDSRAVFSMTGALSDARPDRARLMVSPERKRASVSRIAMRSRSESGDRVSIAAPAATGLDSSG